MDKLVTLCACDSGKGGGEHSDGGLRRRSISVLNVLSLPTTVFDIFRPVRSWCRLQRGIQNPESRAPHLVCGRPKFVPTPTRGRLWTTFFTVAASGKLNMTAAGDKHGQISIRTGIIVILLVRHKIPTY